MNILCNYISTNLHFYFMLQCAFSSVYIIMPITLSYTCTQAVSFNVKLMRRRNITACFQTLYTNNRHHTHQTGMIITEPTFVSRLGCFPSLILSHTIRIPFIFVCSLDSRRQQQNDVIIREVIFTTCCETKEYFHRQSA